MAKPKRQTGELDKFYTNRQAALWLKERTYSMLGPTLPEKKLEPSAGSGAFLEPGDDVVAFDKLPHHERAMQLDDSGHPWIIEMMAYVMSDWPRKELLTLGNPPFGLRGSDAIRFLNVYLQVGGLVAFVLPIVLRKWAGQRRVIKSARLIADWDLPPDMFHLPDGTPYKLECCFQIWSTRETDHRFDDLRITEEPIKTHPDFKMWNAKGASHAGWSKDFDFATLCNGSGRYEERFAPGHRPKDKRRHMLFKARTPAALTILQAIDFDALSKGWAPVPGFGAAEVVEAYKQLQDDDALIEHGKRSLRRAS